jgi:multiple sugar transport system substrate-binding protein
MNNYMKSLLNNIVMGLLLMIAVSFLAGCGKDKAAVGEVNNENPTGAAKVRSELQIDMDKYQGKELHIWAWWDADEHEREIISAFEEASGAKVVWTNIPWSSYKNNVEEAIRSGNGPDVVYFGSEVMPGWVNENHLLPLSDYINYSNPAFSGMVDNAKEAFTIGGKIYAVSKLLPNSYKLYYRKDIFEEKGIEDPYELFTAGKWTWQRFFQIGSALTLDENSDGEIDIWGYDSWMVEQWFYSNGVSIIKYINDKPVFSLDNQAAYNSLGAIRDIDEFHKIKSPWSPGMDPRTKFLEGVTAMLYWGHWDFESFREQLGDKLGFVPFPIGPNFKGETADYINSIAEGIAASSLNPELATLWMEFKALPKTLKEQAAYEEALLKYEIELFGSEELRDLAYKMASQGVYPNHEGFKDLGRILDKIIVRSHHNTAAEAVQQLKEAAQNAVE